LSQARLGERAFQKIVLQRQLSDLRMKGLQINRRWHGLDSAMSENTGRAFEKLTLPLRDLIGVDIELLRQLGQRPLALDRGQGHFRLEGRCVVPTGALRHLIS
jgi:hypothetical protein